MGFLAVAKEQGSVLLPQRGERTHSGPLEGVQGCGETHHGYMSMLLAAP